MKYELKKIIRWFIINALITGAMYVGIIYNNHLATLGAMVLWCDLAITLLACRLVNRGSVQLKKVKPSVPKWVSYAFAVSLGAYLAWNSWPVTGFSVLCQATVASILFEKAEDLRSQEAA